MALIRMETALVSDKTLIWDIPLRTISELNTREHWAKSSKRHRQQKITVSLSLKDKIRLVSLPCIIKIIRISPRILDYDNLVSSQKWVLDSICDLIIPGLK